jgi:hypothetical protein
MSGLEPGIHLLTSEMNCRIKRGNALDNIPL